MDNYNYYYNDTSYSNYKSYHSSHSSYKYGQYNNNNQGYEAKVIQKNVVYLQGIPQMYNNKDTLFKNEFLGQYGNIDKICINKENLSGNEKTFSAFITYSNSYEASIAILALNESVFDDCTLKASFGLSKFCLYYMKNQICHLKNCNNIHEDVSQHDIIYQDENFRYNQLLLAIEYSDIYNNENYIYNAKHDYKNSIFPSLMSIYTKNIVIQNDPRQKSTPSKKTYENDSYSNGRNLYYKSTNFNKIQYIEEDIKSHNEQHNKSTKLHTLAKENSCEINKNSNHFYKNNTIKTNKTNFYNNRNYETNINNPEDLFKGKNNSDYTKRTYILLGSNKLEENSKNNITSDVPDSNSTLSKLIENQIENSCGSCDEKANQVQLKSKGKLINNENEENYSSTDETANTNYYKQLKKNDEIGENIYDETKSQYELDFTSQIAKQSIEKDDIPKYHSESDFKDEYSERKGFFEKKLIKKNIFKETEKSRFDFVEDREYSADDILIPKFISDIINKKCSRHFLYKKHTNLFDYEDFSEVNKNNLKQTNEGFNLLDNIFIDHFFNLLSNMESEVDNNINIKSNILSSQQTVYQSKP